jgi:hypothetical protein
LKWSARFQALKPEPSGGRPWEERHPARGIPRAQPRDVRSAGCDTSVFDVSFGMFSVKTVFCPIAEELSIASSLLVLSSLLSSDGSIFFDELVSLSVGLTFDCH